MGLSKKLGVAANHRSVTSEPLEVAYLWSTQSYTLHDIVTKFKLPCVVQCATDDCSISWSNFQFDFRHPLLLFSRQTVKKVHARNLNLSTLEEFGPPVAIPEDYDGWYGASPKGTNQAKRHTRIESIAKSSATRFVVCTKCPAFTRLEGIEGDVEFIPRDINPGEVFKRVGVIEGDAEHPDTPDVVRHKGPCLECLDEKEDVVIVPLFHRAMMYEISESYPNAEHKVFNTKSIVDGGNSKLPRILTVVHGERPLLDFAYTGMLRCYSVFTEDTIIGATLDEPTALCLELNMDSAAKFRIILNETTIKRTCEYINALQLCKTAGETFLAGIKASFTVQPNTEINDPEYSSVDFGSTSDIHDVDANSEFEIEWSSGHNTDSVKSSPDVNQTKNFQLDYKIKINEPNGASLRENGSEVRSADGDGRQPRNIHPSDFTENEIATLMVRKGMEQRLGASSSSEINLTEEIETLRKTRKVENQALVPAEPMPQEQGTKVVTGHDDYEDIDHAISDDILEMSLEDSNYNAVVCKKANEYVESESDSGDEEEDELGASSVNSIPVCIRIDSIKKNNEDTGRDDNLKQNNNFSTLENLKRKKVSSFLADMDNSTTNTFTDPSQKLPSGFSEGHSIAVSKVSSFEHINGKVRGDESDERDESMLLQRFRSESNVSKIMDKFKGLNDNDKKSKSSRVKLFKPSKKSFPAKDKDSKPFTLDDDLYAFDC